ncbi:hypothetical protein [Micromonospora sp. DPT]
MDWTALGATILTLAVGALIGLVPSLLVERREKKRVSDGSASACRPR